MGLPKLLPQFIILSLILPSTVAAFKMALPRCPDKCKNITIPYPFGTKKGCYLSEFYHVDCTKLSIRNTSLRLLQISLKGQLQGFLPMGHRCYNKTRGITSESEPHINLSRFPISRGMNMLTAIGCDTRADLKGWAGDDYITGCLSMTKCQKPIKGGLCLGMGCSQVLIPDGLTRFRIHAQSNTGLVGKWSFNNCSYAFIVEKDQYSFKQGDFNFNPKRSYPVVLDWTVGNTSCEEAQKNSSTNICKENSYCYDSYNLHGYRCKCYQGYQGNPYLPNGCQDIDECRDPAKSNCTYKCRNTKGSYICLCPKGMRGDGRKDGKGCSYINVAAKPVYIGVGMGTAVSILLTVLLYLGVKQRKILKGREECFKKNGGLILQKLLFESKDTSQKAKIFPARMLEKATNNFHKSNVIGQGGCGTVYKGTLAYNTVVAIKKSKSIDESQIEQFINEVIILSEIRHPNVVKLLGCCLETHTPLLVYEFITNKNLFQHLHEQDYTSSLTFGKRLDIAAQTAEALAHMHSSTQIIHRDIKPSNILLTDDYTAKVSDFGISRFIPMDQTHLQTMVHGTLGYIDPEYFRSGILTEKSDVYSFGMVLVELLTGKKVYSYDGTETDLGLAAYFVSSLERDCLIQILDDQVKKEGFNEQIRKFAKLAKDCVELEGKKRPNMNQVKEALQALRNSYLKESLVSEKIKIIDPDLFLWCD